MSMLAGSLCDYVLRFFFKRKTAYEMRISDWSSDVCSSDLPVSAPPAPASHTMDDMKGMDHSAMPGMNHGTMSTMPMPAKPAASAAPADDMSGMDHSSMRSEEHTSELQSLMRISYAVFCLKKTNIIQ